MTKTAITVILVMTLVITYFAQVQPTAALKTAYIQAYAEPNPVGIGQTMVIGGWITPLPSYSLPNFVYWTNLTFQITKPNGAVVNLGPYTADSAANLAETYVPDQIGNYTFKISWDGASTATSQSYTYAPISANTTFTVQEEAIPSFPDQPWPLPNDYWERPINAQYRSWSIFCGIMVLFARTITRRI